MTLTTVIDVGNFSTKYTYQWKEKTRANSFSSVIHPYKFLEEHEGMSRVEYNELDYFVGDDVKNFYFGREDEMYFGNKRKGHHEAQIRLVTALHNIYKETGQNEFNLVLTSPYESMEADKKYFLKNFEGKHQARIDEQSFEFEIKNIVVAAEGLGAIHFSNSQNCVIVDAGSMTTNVLYLINGSISREDSVTLNGGTINNTMFQLANNFVKACPQVEYDYPIICSGGRSKDLKESLERLGFEDVQVAAAKGKENFYTNSVGLLLKYSEKFEAMFS